jgi:hypothetical protein
MACSWLYSLEMISELVLVYIHNTLSNPANKQVDIRLFWGLHGWVAQDQGFESRSYLITLSPPVHQCSSAGLSNAEWCGLDCLWFMCLKDPLGSFEKSRGISPVPGFQFGPKSESLGLNSRDTHNAQRANANSFWMKDKEWWSCQSHNLHSSLLQTLHHSLTQCFTFLMRVTCPRNPAVPLSTRGMSAARHMRFTWFRAAEI